MSVKVAQIIEAIEKIAPKRYAEIDDPIGLQIGNPAQTVDRVLVTLDMGEEVVDYAVRNEIDMIVCHHPFIYNPLKNLCDDQPAGRKIVKLVKAGIAVYAAHTNYDSCEGGINDILAGRLELTGIEILNDTRAEKMLKLVVFVPTGYEEQIKKAVFDAGAGKYDKYCECEYTSAGAGSFRALDGSKPFTGSVNNVERVEESRIEMLLPDYIKNRVVKALLKAHPYEQPAYDLIELSVPGKAIGLGRIGKLPNETSLEELACSLKTTLKADRASICGDNDMPVRKVALCGGGGSSLMYQALKKGADVFISSEFANHHMVDALDCGLALIEISHFASENIMPEALANYLRRYACSNGWKIADDAIVHNDFTVDYMRNV